MTNDPRWHELAICAQVDPELFFPDTGGFNKQARDICLTCSIRVQCLAFALEHNEEHGIWGGTTPNERRVMRRNQERKAS